MSKYLLLLMVFFTTLYSCSDNDDDKQKDQKETILERVTINNNSADLNSRVSYSNELMVVNSLPQLETKSTKEGIEIDKTKNYAFKLRAQVDAPKVKGNVIQATHVKIADDMAFVSYNTKGNVYQGGVELFNISDGSNPILQAQALFNDVDVSAVEYYNGKIYLAGAIDPESIGYTLESPAILIEMELSPSGQILPVTNIYDLPSYVATDVEVDENYIYVTSGSDGKLTILNHDLSLATDININDARSLSVNSNNIYALDATNEKIQTFNKSDFTELDPILVQGPISDESKTEIDATDKYVFAALNKSGLDICLLDGSLKEHFNRPETPKAD